MGKRNAILHREQGGAKLTIMIQPSGAGSVVKIFTEGSIGAVVTMQDLPRRRRQRTVPLMPSRRKRGRESRTR